MQATSSGRGPSSPAKALFSQHYLTHRIREHEEWAKDARKAFDKFRALYDAKRGILGGLSEAQTEQEFIRPALDRLGFAYIPQTRVDVAGRARWPDYTLFTDATAQTDAYRVRGDQVAFYSRAMAVCDAKYWRRPLSKALAGDARDTVQNTNPSFQMVTYLIGTGVDWGILTNGAIWRLYYRQASSTATEFYEVDLVEVLEADDLEGFKYFWLFFGRDAFVKDAQDHNFLERVREGSATYARVVGDRLKDLVFDEVFPLLSGGFVACAAAREEEPMSDDTRGLIYEASLSLLYKLLFLLYAEARNLLPMDNPGYQAQSATQLARDVARRLDRQEPFGGTSTGLYDRLLNLCRVVDAGDRNLGLPRYNGGLFHFGFTDATDRQEHRANWFLAQHRVSDDAFAHALDHLARVDGEPIDYGFIGVRHLGAIYEGLLEHRLVVDDVCTGRVHLETDKAERKATGSYYTPGYVVQYIIHHTLGPVLQERAERFGALMDQIVDVRKQLGDGRRGPGSIGTLRTRLEQLEHEAREALLDIKVCDPAMGSGHFLVDAVDFLTDGLVDILNQHPEHNPVLSMLERIRQDIEVSLGDQGIPIDPARLDDTQLLQRVVMKRCIYGVDLNTMAVELAKVSLWLHSFTLGAPLSFLDHHLRRGNSLIGARARQAQEELSAELPMFGGPFAGLLRAGEIMRGITLLSDATFVELEESERLFRRFEDAAKPYKQLLDIYVARHFGVRHADEFLRLYGAETVQAGPETVGEPYRTVLYETHRLCQEKHFFHWDLEFPEVFIDLERATWKEEPGFDAVVGNPPYVSANELNKILSEFEKPFWKTQFHSAVGAYDVYILFLEQGIELTCPHGYASMITPNKFLSAPYGQAFREHILRTARLLRLLDQSRVRVFEDASIYPIVSVFQSADAKRHYEIVVETPVAPEDLSILEVIEHQSETLEKLPEMLWGFLISEYLPLILATEDITRELQHCATVRASSTASEADAFEHALRDAPSGSCKKFINTGLIERYDALWGLRALRHKGRVFGSPHLELSHSCVSDERRRQYAKSKIVFAKIARRIEGFFDKEGEYASANTNFAYDSACDLAYLVAVLNSRLLSALYEAYFGALVMSGGYLQFQAPQLRVLPIRRIALITPAKERARLAEAAKQLIEPWTSNHGVPSNYAFFLSSELGHWLDERISPTHVPGPALVRQHNTDPLNIHWQLPEEGHVEQSDVVHDLLSQLAGAMIEMNQQKHSHLTSFRLDLAGYLDDKRLGKLNRLHTPKKVPKEGTKNYAKRVATYEEAVALANAQLGSLARETLHLDDFWRLNEAQWIWVLRQRLGEVANMSALVAVFEQYRSQLASLMRRIERTDRTIDLIVYRLYGLTEEEVAIVEESATR